jgi:hypothetical protein
VPQSRLLVVRRGNGRIGRLRDHDHDHHVSVHAVDTLHAVGIVVTVVAVAVDGFAGIVGLVVRDAVRRAVESVRRLVREPGVERRRDAFGGLAVVLAVGLGVDRRRRAG